MPLLPPITRRLFLAISIAVYPASAWAENFPARPVKIIVQTAAGSALDVLMRVVNEQLSQIWGRGVIVVNQAGAGGLNAARLAAVSDPDGYTLFLAGGSVFVALPELHRDLPFDVNEFVPVGFVAEEPYGILISNSLGLDSVSDLITASKKQPEGLNVVAGTVGGLQHLTAERFRQASGANLNMIHYPGTNQSLNDVISGRVPVMFQNLSPIVGSITSGAVKLLAITSRERMQNFPHVPTVSETLPGFTVSGWSVLVAPPGTSRAIAQKINGDLQRALESPPLVERFHEMGYYTRSMAPQDLSDYINEQRQIWRPIVRKISAEQ